MKKLLPIFLLFILLTSCAKDGSKILKKDPSFFRYFPNFVTDSNNNSNLNRKTFTAVYPNPNNGFVLNIAYNFINITTENESLYGSFNMDDSYIYDNYNNYYKNYKESINIKADDKDNVDFIIRERHENINLGSYKYDITMSPYRLHIIKENLKLNDTWTNTESVTFVYNKFSSYAPVIANTTSDIKFEYLVEEIHEIKNFQGIKYEDVMKIKVSYSKDNVSYYRVYYFALNVGLVKFNINGMEYELYNY